MNRPFDLQTPDRLDQNPGQRPGPAPLHDAQALTNGGRLALIHLDGQVYSLRITRQGKLILTK